MQEKTIKQIVITYQREKIHTISNVLFIKKELTFDSSMLVEY